MFEQEIAKFIPYFTDFMKEKTFLDYMYYSKTANKVFSNSMVLKQGLSKNVFFIPDCDWVFKSPILCEQIDFCAIEAEKYAVAQLAKMDRYFAGTFPIGEICGYTFYISEKAKCDEKTISSTPNSLDYDNAKNHYSELWRSRSVGEKFLLDYGLEASIELADFIEQNDISDLHTGNAGFNKENKIVLIDYSGYWEGTCENYSYSYSYTS